MSIDRGKVKEDVVHTYKGISFSHKKNEIMLFTARWMELEIIILSEVSQKKKDKYHVISLICGISNMTQMNLSMKQTHRHRELIYGCPGLGKGIDWQYGSSR